ncbi:MAG: AmmeMemoRadiSam system radical SAM enzyme [Spirochaetae bacterium HGW-Spirochaetae-1]|jgi:pyruvate formate lyase activating enzyme|nr:MAG: AmmeMemoRadiSam system radical SAM enzyme [Spirochaetae bacterium HGW-Spirochaetae-1]
MAQGKEAYYYEKLDALRVACHLCPHNCVIPEKKTGICGVRINKQGLLYSEIYGQVTAISMDPMEKKPLYHFYPGTEILSIGTKGCNFKCPYCQNWHISQDVTAHAVYHEPDEIIELALKKKSTGIAYTYSEPAIWIEYVLEMAEKARIKGLKNVMVTNGFINEKPLTDLLRFIDAMNIDLKAFRPETYKKIQKGNLDDVLNTIKISHERECHIELTTLIVTGVNDDMDEMKHIIEFIASIDVMIPWHISRYYPSYQYDAPPTDVDFLLQVHKEASKTLKYVYCGNISPHLGGSDTTCPSCGTVLVKRSGYFTRIVSLDRGKCRNCGFDTGIVS